VQPVPYAQPWFLGVANLRGGLYGVVTGGFVRAVPVVRFAAQ
jgi:twitching motility protein PilI